MNESFVRELTMDELELIAGGWDWGNVNWGRAAAIGGAGALETAKHKSRYIPIDQRDMR